MVQESLVEGARADWSRVVPPSHILRSSPWSPASRRPRARELTVAPPAEHGRAERRHVLRSLDRWMPARLCLFSFLPQGLVQDSCFR